MTNGICSVYPILRLCVCTKTENWNIRSQAKYHRQNYNPPTAKCKE